MARIRTVKPELFRHELLFELELKTKLPIRIAWVGLFTVADREGKFRWRPNVLKLDVLPFDDVDFSLVLDALQEFGFVKKYSHEGETYGVIPSWLEHQVINQREAKSTLPNIEDSEESKVTHVHAHASTETTLPEHVQTHGEGKGREGNVYVGKQPGIRTEYPDTYNQLWNLYEKRGDKSGAFQVYKKLKLSEEEECLLRTKIAILKTIPKGWEYRVHFQRFLKTDWREIQPKLSQTPVKVLTLEDVR